MVSESFAIIAVLLLVILVSRKAGYKQFLLLQLPFFAVPIVYLLGETLTSLFTIPKETVQILPFIMVALGGIAGGLATLFFSKWIRQSSSQKQYIFFGLLFSLGFTGAYIVNLV